MRRLPPLKFLSTRAEASSAGSPPEPGAEAAALTRLIHIHIPKCAGTTLDHVLFGAAAAIGRDMIRFHGTIYGQGFAGLGKRESWKHAQRVDYPKDWLFASGHIPYGRFPRCREKVNEVCVIRDPLSRLTSMFQMGANLGAWSATTPIGKLFDAGLFAADSMVRQLVGETSKDRELDPRSVETALHNFENIKYAGAIDDFDSVVGSILGDFGIPYLAYHSYQIGRSIEDLEHRRLAAGFAPFMELDRLFYDRAVAIGGTSNRVRVVSIRHIAPSAPILVVSPALVSEEGTRIDSALVTVEKVARNFDL